MLQRVQADFTDSVYAGQSDVSEALWAAEAGIPEIEASIGAYPLYSEILDYWSAYEALEPIDQNRVKRGERIELVQKIVQACQDIRLKYASSVYNKNGFVSKQMQRLDVKIKEERAKMKEYWKNQ